MDSLNCFAVVPAPLFVGSGFDRSKRRAWPQRLRSFAAGRIETAVAAQSADELQDQLAALVDEARSARTRADKARARFMRLTESVEQMNLRAAAEIKAGNEDAARQLIKEKKKVMAALDLSRKRAEVLEEFAIKLNEVISMKETRLMASLSMEALNIDAESTTSASSVRIVPPKEDIEIKEKGGGDLDYEGEAEQHF